MRYLMAASVFILSACVTNPEPVTTRNSELTHGNVQMNLRLGETTQNDVLETFGAPNVMTSDAGGNEVWTYQRAAQVSQSSTKENAWTVIFFGRSASASGFESASRMITLIIKFDDNKVVNDFRSRTSTF